MNGDIDKKPGISISNAQIALLISCWFVYSQVRTAIVASTTRDMERKSNTEAVVRHGEALTKILEDEGIIDRIEAEVATITASIESVRGDVKASRDRAYEAETAISKNVARLEAEVNKAHAEINEAGVVDLSPILSALSSMSAEIAAVKAAVARDQRPVASP